MSSFIISKEEYMKAAGLLYGFEAAKPRPHKWFLEHVKSMFLRCYELNVASVNEQYNDIALPEEYSYDEIFEAYKEFGRNFFHKYRVQFVTMIIIFFRSVVYQVESSAAEQEICAWFYTCIEHLTDDLVECEAEWWGEININDLFSEGGDK